MIGLELGEARVLVRPGATDMRKQINGLALIVQEQMEMDPFQDALFVFCNRGRRIVKALYWDRTGFCLWIKRLERHRFPWPRNATEAQQQIDTSQLRLLLCGVDFWSAHQEVSYTKVG